MIDQKLLQQAITVLRTINEKHYEDSSKKKPLLEDEKETTLYLQISLKKIPKYKSVKMIKVNLPHSLMKDNSEVCLITGDLDKKNHKAEIEPDVLHYKELLKKHGIDNISEVVTLRQLRTEYKPYEAKQKLLAAYDVFLADRKIAECLPKVLGRHFFKKRKFPIQITLNTPNLKQQVEKALSTKVFFLTGHGNSCNSEVAHLDMSNAEISENVTAMAKAFCDELPGSWNNVMGMYLKTSLSKAIPVYVSYDDPNTVKLDEEKCDNSYEIDELSTCLNSNVKVYKDGTVKTVRVKRLPDTEIDESSESRRKSKRKGKNKEGILETETDKKIMWGIEKDYVKVYIGGRTETIRFKRLPDSELDKHVKPNGKKYDDGFLKIHEDGTAITTLVSIMPEAEMVLGVPTDDVTTDSNMKKNKENIVNDSDTSLTNVDINDESSKSRRKSKRKKINKEGILEIETVKKSMCDLEKRVKLNEKEFGDSYLKVYEDGTVITCLISRMPDAEMEEIKVEEAKDIPQKSSRKKIKKTVLTDENDKTVACSGLKGESKEISKKSKNTRKSVGNMLMREADENSTNADEMEKLPKLIGKPKSKRIREKSMLSDANTYSPVQVAKKKNAEENLKRSHSAKGNSKGKQKKRL